ncbi:MAG TPA: DinB family protein [Thermoanaerobaculia bacterium]
MPQSEKEQFLQTYDREHTITMRVLNAFPKDKGDFRPHERLKTARELAWVIALERYLGMRVFHDEFAKGMPTGSTPPKPPETWDALLAGIEKGSREYRDMISAAPDADLSKQVHFLTAPKTMGTTPRIDWLWFLLSDEIHHRGQFSLYVRAVGAKLPSIYGPTADEPWF